MRVGGSRLPGGGAVAGIAGACCDEVGGILARCKRAVVTGGAVVGDGCVGPVECVVIIVNGKTRRLPAVGRMAGFTIRRNGQCYVVGVGCLIIVLTIVR